ncbi:hypothetical protein MDAP_001842 [Mitosporidium daphniae]|uniref:Cytoplasmic tRNA 2-thiolation protein 2 n=1 Tax=Mitosporidium daphniae TaxID=1485682 RepID=A0A098VN52_9MICR|nr:uncharacterized protein DI09_7p130 [Mitosporidium daphniae]KGG50234.1 hypothetical protein DI09_7p130 [Mitosporidium daphniae]|eukprot:XP_013236661.1 uncharacterized protein DI09_7p130 [Mitosporidium daphniae]
MNSSQVNCIKCKRVPFVFSFRDFHYCKPCFIEQYKQKIGHALSAQPKSLIASKIGQDKTCTIVVALWDTQDSLALLKFVLHYELGVNSKYRGISYKFLLFLAKGCHGKPKYMPQIRALLVGYSDVSEQEEDRTDVFLIKTLLKSETLKSNDLVYIPSAQYDVAFFTLFLTLNGHGSLIPAFSTPSIVISSIRDAIVHVCRPLFYLCKEEIAFFNGIAQEMANLDPVSDGSLDSIRCDLDSLANLKLDASSICGHDFPYSSSKSGANVSESAKNNDQHGLASLVDSFIDELQRDSNDASVSILARTAQKLDSSFLACNQRCAQCPLPDFRQTTPCDACADNKL